MRGSCSLVSALLFCAIPVVADDNIVLRWNDLLLEMIRRNSTPPPIATRMLAITHTAMFDAWAAYDASAVGTLTGDTLRRPAAEHTASNKEAAMSYAAYRALLDLYPAQKDLLNSQMRALKYDPSDDSRDVAKPAGIGNSVAAGILEFRHRDGSNQLGDLSPGAYSDYTGYQPVNDVNSIRDPNSWQPLRLPNGQAQTWLLPHWGRVTGFALTPTDQFRPGAPPFYGNDLYDERCEDIRRISARLTDRQKMIAEYWEDGAGTVTPPGHWNQIATAVSYRDQHSLDDDVKLFFALTNAQFDAGIAVWDCKRFYDYVRPASAIRMMNAGKLVAAWAGPNRGTQMIPGDQWQPYLTTPPFAEYPSGHSTFSSASAEILQLFCRSDNYGASVTFEPGSSRIEPGATPKMAVKLYWATFADAADEAGLSRRLGGIHFEDGDIRGRILGRLIARQVWAKANFYFGSR